MAEIHTMQYNVSEIQSAMPSIEKYEESTVESIDSINILSVKVGKYIYCQNYD